LLNAVHGPQRLLFRLDVFSRSRVDHFDATLERPVVGRGMIRRERDVIRGMVVLRRDADRKSRMCKQRVYRRGQVASTVYRERSILRRGREMISMSNGVRHIEKLYLPADKSPLAYQPRSTQLSL
jgi:hypothetical protein